APTPSAAAELVIRSRQDIEEQAQSLHQRLARAVRYHLLLVRQQLTELAQHGTFARMADAIARRHQRLDDLIYRLATAERALLARDRRRLDIAAEGVRHHDLRRVLAGVRRDLQAQLAALLASSRAHLLRHRSRFEQLQARLQGLSPLNILDRGYALVFDAEGKLVKDAAQVRSGQEIRARLAKGELTATVKGRQV
ncbi:MAG TPA: exodeoxyribonuclease VII large subunit, partial [Terriglobales bacterium]|nr:exodeoxyribonuclease VII large subunit [Terriglobales bacterium]